MNWKKPLLATISYTIITFAIAIIWHMVLFESLYLGWGYFGENPGFLLGFLSMVTQGAILSFGYQFLKLSKWKFVSIAGLYHWTVHVLAFMAKAEVARNIGFFGMETFYLIIQFGLYGLIIGLIWRKK
jgi:hypothetical protein